MPLDTRDRRQIESVKRALEHATNTCDDNEIWRSLMFAAKTIHDTLDQMYPGKRTRENLGA